MDESEPTTRIEASEAGRRVDHVVAARLAVSRRHVWRLLAGGAVTLNGQVLGRKHKGRRVDAGEVLNISDVQRLEQPEANAQLELVEAARGEGWVVVCKPADMAVHPLAAHEQATALNALIHRYPDIAGVGEGGLRAGVVHRLDVATSGAVVFARDQPTWDALRAAFSDGAVRKTYHALVFGRVTETARQTRDLRVVRHRPARVEVVEPQKADARARRCALSYRPLETLAATTLLEVTLETGFLHQIRVMLAAEGHPVVGDATYGRGEALDQRAGRLMLHAYQLQWQAIDATCPWPDDFARVIETLRSE